MPVRENKFCLLVKINNRQLNELYANTIYNNITQVSRKGIYV